MFRYFRNSLAAICLIAAAAAVVLMPAPAAAQILYGSLTGTVTDQQKAAMPGVTVTATNTGTDRGDEAVTDDSGNYTIRNLVPGIYDVTAVLQGFRELRQRGMNITAGNIVRVDLALQLGQLVRDGQRRRREHAAPDGEGRPQHRALGQGGRRTCR